MRRGREGRESGVTASIDVNELIRMLEAFGRAHDEVRLIYLHGSVAKATHGPLSDIDVGVLLDPVFFAKDRLALEFAGDLQAACPFGEVDLVILNDAGPIIRDRVVRNGLVVYAKDPKEKVRFEAKAIKDMFDFSYFSNRYNKALFDQLSGDKSND